jgi:hypothetical protein
VREFGAEAKLEVVDVPSSEGDDEIFVGLAVAV